MRACGRGRRTLRKCRTHPTCGPVHMRHSEGHGHLSSPSTPISLAEPSVLFFPHDCALFFLSSLLPLSQYFHFILCKTYKSLCIFWPCATPHVSAWLSCAVLSIHRSSSFQLVVLIILDRTFWPPSHAIIICGPCGCHPLLCIHIQIRLKNSSLL